LFEQLRTAQGRLRPQSERLVTIFNTYPKTGVERDGSSLTNTTSGVEDSEGN
jgi:hypothetical protein